jgi:hypothetical protein
MAKVLGAMSVPIGIILSRIWATASAFGAEVHLSALRRL